MLARDIETKPVMPPLLRRGGHAGARAGRLAAFST